MLKDPWVQILALIAFVSGAFFAAPYLSKIFPTASPEMQAPAPFPVFQPEPKTLPKPIPIVASSPESSQAPRVVSHSPVWIVDSQNKPDADGRAISDVIDKVKNGDTILIRPGKYKGHVVISKSITLSGSDRDPAAVTITSSDSPTFSIQGGEVSIKNVNIVNSVIQSGIAILAAHAKLFLSKVSITSQGEGLHLIDGVFSAQHSSFKGRIALLAGPSSRLNVSDCKILGVDSGALLFGDDIIAQFSKSQFLSGWRALNINGDSQIFVDGSQFILSKSEGALFAFAQAHVQIQNSTINLSGTSQTGLYADKSEIKGLGLSIQGAVGPAVVALENSTISLKNTRILHNKNCALRSSQASITLEGSVFSYNRCGINFQGPTVLEANKSHFFKNTNGTLNIVPGMESFIRLRGSGNSGIDLQVLKHNESLERDPVQFKNDIFSSHDSFKNQ